jgi:hypothetical protein
MKYFDNVAFVTEVNSKIAIHVDRARRTLIGAAVFDVDSVRELMVLVSQMEPHVRAARRPNTQASREFSFQMDVYRKHLQGLSKSIEQIRMMLLARRGELEFSHRHMSAVSRWTSAYQQTKDD